MLRKPKDFYNGHLSSESPGAAPVYLMKIGSWLRFHTELYPFQIPLNPIPVELWNDVNRRGRAIMARIEFLPQI